MNNIKNSLLFGALSVVALTSCVSEITDLNTVGKDMGTMELNVDIVQPQTRAVTEVSDFPVIIYDSEGKEVVKEYATVSVVPERITLPVGKYMVQSHTPGEIEKKMNKPYYKGVVEAEIIKLNTNSKVDVLCKMKNSPISVTYDDDFRDVFSSWDITVDDGSEGSTTAFAFSEDSSAPFYWYFGEEGVSELKLNFTGITKADGSTVKQPLIMKKDTNSPHYDNDNPNFSGGDALQINIKPVESTEGKITSIAINATVTFTETNDTVDVVVIEKDDLNESLLPNGLSFSANTASAVLGQDFTSPVLSNPHNLTLSWTSSNTAVATVNQSGEVTLKSAGETTITATFAGDAVYEAGSVQYKLTVEASGGDDKITLTIPAPVTLSKDESATADPTSGDVVMHADNGLKSIMVKVNSSSEEMMEQLAAVADGYPGVDLVNGCEVVGNQNLVAFLGGLDKVITVPDEGQQDYTFPVGQFYLFLGILPGEHNFVMTVTDMKGNKKTGTVKVTITE